jgi:hypothetical protein
MITKKEHPKKWYGSRGEKTAQDNSDAGEDDTFFLGHLSEFGHTDEPFLAAGQKSHDGRLNDGD